MEGDPKAYKVWEDPQRTVSSAARAIFVVVEDREHVRPHLPSFALSLPSVEQVPVSIVWRDLHDGLLFVLELMRMQDYHELPTSEKWSFVLWKINYCYSQVGMSKGRGPKCREVQGTPTLSCYCREVFSCNVQWQLLSCFSVITIPGENSGANPSKRVAYCL